jgi:hypothetical protein
MRHDARDLVARQRHQIAVLREQLQIFGSLVLNEPFQTAPVAMLDRDTRKCRHDAGRVGKRAYKSGQCRDAIGIEASRRHSTRGNAVANDPRDLNGRATLRRGRCDDVGSAFGAASISAVAADTVCGEERRAIGNGLTRRCARGLQAL